MDQNDQDDQNRQLLKSNMTNRQKAGKKRGNEFKESRPKSHKEK